MPAAEWDVWLAYSGRFRLGPYQDDYRAAVVAASIGGGRTAEEMFPSLRAVDRGGRSFRAWALSRAPGHVPPGDSGH